MRPLFQDRERVVLIHINKHRKPNKMKRQQYISQIKEAKLPEKNPKETEMSNLPYEAVIRILMKLESGTEKLRENFETEKLYKEPRI